MAAAVATAGPAAASMAPLQATFPAPTGPDAIGTVSLHLVQAGRPDPWVPGQTRELMVSLWHPAHDVDRYPIAPYMPAGAWASLEHNRGIPGGSVAVPRTAGHDGSGGPPSGRPAGDPLLAALDR